MRLLLLSFAAFLLLVPSSFAADNSDLDQLEKQELKKIDQSVPDLSPSARKNPPGKEAVGEKEKQAPVEELKKHPSFFHLHRPFEFGFNIGTDGPLDISAGIHALIYERLYLQLGGGFVPSFYGSTYGTAMASWSVQANQGVWAGLTSNNAWDVKGLAEYRFSGREGFGIGAAIIFVSTESDPDIVSFLESPTGEDYTILKNYLAAVASQRKIHATGSFLQTEFFASYGIAFSQHWLLKLGAGVTKFYSATINLSSASNTFDNSYTTQYQRTINKLDNVLLNYGYTPNLFAELHFDF